MTICNDVSIDIAKGDQREQNCKGMYMNLKLQKLCVLAVLVLSPLSMIATHYSNKTGKTIIITNVTAKKKSKKSYFSQYGKKKASESASQAVAVTSLELENGMEGDLDNNQGDEITITSPGMSDKRKLFPTNNSFNYVVTLNEYNKKFEKFDINRAGSEEEMMPEGGKKIEKTKKEKKKKERAKKYKAAQE